MWAGGNERGDDGEEISRGQRESAGGGWTAARDGKSCRRPGRWWKRRRVEKDLLEEDGGVYIYVFSPSSGSPPHAVSRDLGAWHGSYRLAISGKQPGSLLSSEHCSCTSRFGFPQNSPKFTLKLQTKGSQDSEMIMNSTNLCVTLVWLDQQSAQKLPLCVLVLLMTFICNHWISSEMVYFLQIFKHELLSKLSSSPNPCIGLALMQEYLESKSHDANTIYHWKT